MYHLYSPVGAIMHPQLILGPLARANLPSSNGTVISPAIFARQQGAPNNNPLEKNSFSATVAQISAKLSDLYVNIHTTFKMFTSCSNTPSKPVVK